MTSSKVSVVIPVYNVAEFLGECVNSVCSQSFQDIEVILVDDGSTDASGSICDRFAAEDGRIRVIHKPNAGVSAARNSGIEAASGEWICFVDGDDYVLPDYVEYLLSLTLGNDAEVAATRGIMSDYDTKQVESDKLVVLDGAQATVDILCYRFPVGCYSKLFRRDYLNSNGIRFIEELRMGEDFNFSCMAFQHARQVACGERRVYHYRRNNPHSATVAFNESRWETGLYAIDLIGKNMVLQGPEIERALRYARWRTHSDAYDQIVLSGSERTCPEMYQRCLAVVRHGMGTALSVPISKKDRLRAIVMSICPKAIPWAMTVRRKRHEAAAGARKGAEQ